MVYKGREVKPDQTVEAAGLAAGAVLTTVRKALVAEGWKVGAQGDLHPVKCSSKCIDSKVILSLGTERHTNTVHDWYVALTHQHTFACFVACSHYLCSML